MNMGRNGQGGEMIVLLTKNPGQMTKKVTQNSEIVEGKDSTIEVILHIRNIGIEGADPEIGAQKEGKIDRHTQMIKGYYNNFL